MPHVEFDRTIETDLPADELWRLMVRAFEDPSSSPIWPVDLEETHPVEMREGAKVSATYKLGPVEVGAAYHITEFEPGQFFSYKSDRSHPLKGGATVSVDARAGRATLRWRGAYTTRLHPMAPFAYLFVRLYFVRSFFRRLEANIRDYEDQFPGPRRQPPRPGP